MSRNNTFNPESLMAHFQNQGKWKEWNRIHETEIKTFLEDKANYKHNDITDKPITVSEVKNIIGPDRILNEIIKSICPVLVKSIT